ncbi:hypothetical protein M9Y10_001426 [Tritrichomonas musculus]|uniref:beta-N-acetylhexosaminidase n=1 Tax=Tritrichomonas musculus TaxID=1915356 RepID=A0ABR2L6Z4_9EUKA
MFFLFFALISSKISIIPEPVSLTEVEGQTWTLLKDGMAIGYDKSISSYAKELANFISDSIYTPTGIRLPVTEGSNIKIGIQLGSSTDDEYHLIMDSNLITILAKNRELLFDGFQTFLQLLPTEIYFNKTVKESVSWTAPCVIVHDKPRFQWRGIMIDVCRHFFDVDTIKSIIDGMSHFKLNVLHFHITEDQGLRLQLKKFPNLTEFGSKRDSSPKHHSPGQLDGIPYGPYFYTEEEITEIIEYARERSISILPEIEMPGHALALLSGYPQYSCTGGPFKPRCLWGVEQDILCAGNDETIKFLEELLDEVIRLFDNVFISCGGDECPRTRWQKCPKCQQRIKDEGLKNEDQLQSWFTIHFAKFLESKGRRLVGWDEILAGNLEFPKSSVVMIWHNDRAQKAASLGHDVVISVNTHCYLDYRQFRANDKFEYYGLPNPVTTYNIYHFNPTDGISEDCTSKIIGLQGNLWSEYVWERTDLQYKIFPRCIAISETGWVENDKKNWQRFVNSYSYKASKILQNMGIVDAGLQFGPPGQWKKGELFKDKWVSVEFPLDQAVNVNGNLEAAFAYKDGLCETHVRNVKLLFTDAVAATDEHESVVGFESENSVYNMYTTTKATPTSIKIQAEMMCKGGDDCEGEIFLYVRT